MTINTHLKPERKSDLARTEPRMLLRQKGTALADIQIPNHRAIERKVLLI